MAIKGFFQTRLTAFIILLGIIVYIVAAASVSLNRYWQFNAFWYDLGLYDTAIYKVAHFKAPIIEQFAPPDGKIIFADHFNPSLFIFSPIYWFTDKTEAILIAQAVTVGLSAWIAYFIAKKFIKQKITILALVISYLGFVGLQNALYTDFHDTTVATLSLMLTFWAIFSKKWKFYWLFLAVTLGFKESMAGLGVGLGLFLMLAKPRNLKIGYLTIIFSILYFFVVTKIIIPYFSGGSYSYVPQLAAYTPLDVVWSFFAPSIKANTIIYSLLTFGFAPIFSLATLPAITEHFAERFVLSQAGTRWDLGFHYNALLSPLLFIATLPFVTFLQKRSKFLLSTWSITTISMVIFLHRFYLHGPLLLAHHPVFYQDTKRAQFMRDFVDAVPVERELIMTGNNIAAHLSHKSVTLINLVNFDDISPSVVALDLRGGQNANNFFPATYDDAKALYNYLYNNPNYERIGYNGFQHIFVKTK